MLIYIILNSKIMDEGFREQTVILLREQAGKLRLMGREMQIREEQICFLKEAILGLQEEKDALLTQNNQLRNRIRLMVQQIQNYNDNVVQKIYAENENFANQIKQYTKEVEELRTIVKDGEKVLLGTQLKLKQSQQEHQQVRQSLQEASQGKFKIQKKMQSLEKQNRQLQLKLLQSHQKMEELKGQLNLFSQQIDILTQKHHQSQRNGEKKLKAVTQKMIGKEIYEELEKQLKDFQTKNKTIRSEIDKLIRENQHLRFQCLSLRDKQLKNEVKQETKYQILRVDLLNLWESCKLGRKIQHFQSQESQWCEWIWCCLSEQKGKTDSIRVQNDGLKAKIQYVNVQNRLWGQRYEQLQNQVRLLRDRGQAEREQLQLSYQNKIMQVSLKLRKEEIALGALKQKQKQYEELLNRCGKLQQKNNILATDLNNYQQASRNTIRQMQRQNQRIIAELCQAIKMCEEGIQSRKVIAQCKYLLGQLLSVIYFLEKLNRSLRERVVKIYSPFIDYYFLIHKKIKNDECKQKQKSKPRGIKLFRIGVHMIIAMQRMKRNIFGKNILKGLDYYIQFAINRRHKIENLNQYLEKIIENIGKDVNEIIKFGQQIYKWNLFNYAKINLPIGQDLTALKQQAQVRLSFDD